MWNSKKKKDFFFLLFVLSKVMNTSRATDDVMTLRLEAETHLGLLLLLPWFSVQ